MVRKLEEIRNGRRPSGGSKINIVRLFAMGVGVVLLLVMLEWFRRVIMGMGLPRWKAVVFIAGSAIGSSMATFGVRELHSGRWIGAIWIPVGIGLCYIAAREVWPAMTEVKANKGLVPPVRTRTGRFVELLAYVLFALLMGIILMLSGRSDFRI